jgi:hypothetical protein
LVHVSSPWHVAIRFCLAGNCSHILSCVFVFDSPAPTSPEPKKNQSTSNLIPPCACGAVRVFETQVLSSLLHVLEVDKHAQSTNVDGSTAASASGLGAAYEHGGMNWGSIAVYSCPNVCAADEEYVVVQDSIDERPSQPRSAYEDADAILIPEDANFGDDDDDDDDDEGDWGVDVDDPNDEEEMICS